MFSPDVILYGWLGSKHQLTNSLPGKWHEQIKLWVQLFRKKKIMKLITSWVSQKGGIEKREILGSAKSMQSCIVTWRDKALSIKLITSWMIQKGGIEKGEYLAARKACKAMLWPEQIKLWVQLFWKKKKKKKIKLITSWMIQEDGIEKRGILGSAKSMQSYVVTWTDKALSTAVLKRRKKKIKLITSWMIQKDGIEKGWILGSAKSMQSFVVTWRDKALSIAVQNKRSN